MAIKQNPSLDNRHTAYVAMSGYGKSQALKQNEDIPKAGARVLLWDPDEDHKAMHFDNKSKFVKAVAAAMRRGGGFRLAWAGEVNNKTFEWFCRIVWECMNGGVPLFCVIEEMADVSLTSGKASHWCGQLFRRGRKYNLILHWTTQRSQEVPKTCYSQSAVKYIGYPDETCSPRNADELGRIAGVAGSDLYALQPLEFFRRENKATKRVKLKYKKTA